MGLKHKEGFSLNDLFFLIVGNFLTCCFSRNFTPFELLKKPLSFKLKRQQNFLITNIPKGIPWKDAILRINDVIATRVRDIPVQKGLKEVDKNTDLFIVDISLFIKTKGLMISENLLQEGELTYSPWYRFVNEPYRFDLDINSTNYIAQSVAYLLKSQKINNNIEDNVSDSVSTIIVDDIEFPVDKIEIEGESQISEIRLSGREGTSVLNLKDKKISLYSEHSRICFDALACATENAFKNVKLVKNERNIELSYEQ